MDIIASLRENICEVTFEKANGDERTMICTLIADFLPFNDEDRDVGVHPSDTVTVWDIEENAWRSFKPSKLLNIKFSKE